MDALLTLFDQLRKSGRTQGHLRGMFHVLIGRTITNQNDQSVISKGMTWRELAGWLKKVRWDTDAVREIGLEPKNLPPRDRQRFWYSAIAHAKVTSADAVNAGDKFAEVMKDLGYDVSAAP